MPERAADKPRSGWEAAFRRMAAQGDDVLLDRRLPLPTQWGETE